MKNAYQLLGISTGANRENIKKAYYGLARDYHPDKDHSPEAKARFQTLAAAYEVLSDPHKKNLYDLFGQGFVYPTDAAKREALEEEINRLKGLPSHERRAELTLNHELFKECYIHLPHPTFGDDFLALYELDTLEAILRSPDVIKTVMDDFYFEHFYTLLKLFPPEKRWSLLTNPPHYTLSALYRELLNSQPPFVRVPNIFKELILNPMLEMEKLDTSMEKIKNARLVNALTALKNALQTEIQKINSSDPLDYDEVLSLMRSTTRLIHTLHSTPQESLQEINDYYEAYATKSNAFQEAVAVIAVIAFGLILAASLFVLFCLWVSLVPIPPALILLWVTVNTSAAFISSFVGTFAFLLSAEEMVSSVALSLNKFAFFQSDLQRCQREVAEAAYQCAEQEKETVGVYTTNNYLALELASAF